MKKSDKVTDVSNRKLKMDNIYKLIRAMTVFLNRKVDIRAPFMQYDSNKDRDKIFDMYICEYKSKLKKEFTAILKELAIEKKLINREIEDIIIKIDKSHKNIELDDLLLNLNFFDIIDDNELEKIKTLTIKTEDIMIKSKSKGFKRILNNKKVSNKNSKRVLIRDKFISKSKIANKVTSASKK